LRIPTFVLVLLLAQVGWQGDQKLPVPSRVAEAMVDSMAEEYYGAKFRCYPAVATLQGVAGYDGKLSTYSQRSIFGLLTKIRNLHGTLLTLDEDSLSMGKWCDYKALLADMETERFLLEDLELWRTRPTMYVDACVDGVAFLYLRHIGGDSASAMAPRLRAIPEVVKQARRNLNDPSEFHCRVAAERLGALIAMLDGLTGEAADLGVDAALIAESIAALEGFGAFLDSLSLSADTRFALTYDDFLVLTDTRNMISDTPEAVRTYAQRVLDNANLELEEYVDTPSSGASGGQPPAGIEDLRAWLASALDLVRDEGLVSLPAEEQGSAAEIRILELPPALAHLYGDMVYLDPRQGGGPAGAALLFVSSEIGGPGTGPAAIIASEAIPGRHMQAVAARFSSSPVRNASRDLFATNGWALYAQELAAREGLGGDQAVRDALQRKRFYAAGTIAAVNILLGEFTVQAAADFMEGETGVSEVYARQAALQYALEPEQPMSYIIGDRQIRLIRDEVSRLLGPNFKLGDFHDSLLASGRLPLYLVRNNVVSGSVGRR
jgi:hypothetical protein